MLVGCSAFGASAPADFVRDFSSVAQGFVSAVEEGFIEGVFEVRIPAERVGLQRLDSGPLVSLAAEETSFIIEKGAEAPAVALVLDQVRWVGRPVSTEWALIAECRGFIIVTMGVDGFPGIHREPDPELDKYLGRILRLYAARVEASKDA